MQLNRCNLVWDDSFGETVRVQGLRLNENGRAEALPLTANPNPLLLIDRLLQIRPRRKPRHLARRNLDGCTRLRVASVACLARRHGECSKSDQRHAVALFQRTRDALHRRINRSRGLSFRDPASARYFVDQIAFIHQCLLRGSSG